MDDLLGVSANRCQCTRGVILVTPCQAVAVDRCFRCGMRLCLEHAMPLQGGILCPTCAATGETYVTSDSVVADTTSDSTISGAPATDEPEADEPLAPATNAAPPHDDDLFTDADYDAFDGAGDADMNAGISDGFDS